MIEREVAGLFHDLRITGNTATHGLQGDHASALSSLKIALDAFRTNEGGIAELLSAAESQLRLALDEQQQRRGLQQVLHRFNEAVWAA